MVAGAGYLLSGTYYVDDVSDAYLRYGGVAVYVLGKYSNGAWYLGEGTAVEDVDDDYPYYYVSPCIHRQGRRCARSSRHCSFRAHSLL